MKKVLAFCLRMVAVAARWAGFNLRVNVQLARLQKSEALNLNIGAGKKPLPNFVSLDFYSPHYYPSEKSFRKTRVPYDLRRDSIPFQDSTVRNIYVSHVLEHIERVYVEKFFEEAHRCLEPNGVMRIACPDSQFLWEVSQFPNDFWAWRSDLASDSRYQMSAPTTSQFDYFLREMATPRLAGYRAANPNLVLESSGLNSLDYEEVLGLLEVPEFREGFPGDHITPWDFTMICDLGVRAGFARVIRSKPGGSVSGAMQGLDFDTVHPNMSLYADLVK